jgi:NAD(P)-dependent dehydrogenase (short-subunit alcohol dehydrogenase family)
MSVQGLVVAVSGGCGRIGSALAAAIVKDGGKVLLADVADAKGKEMQTSLGAAALYSHCDVTDAAQIDSSLEAAARRFGKLDAAVHCAYPRTGSWGADFFSLQAADLAENLRLQLGGAILFSQRTLRRFEQQGSGNLLHVSSIFGVSPPRFEQYEGTRMTMPIEYAAIKAGIVSITRYLAERMKNRGVRVNCVSPGGIRDDQPEAFLARYREHCASKGMLDAQDVVGTALFLLSPESRYITGQNIVVDDGWTL